MKLFQDFRPRNVLMVFLLLLILAGVGSFTADWVFMHDERILPNVYLAYVDVGGMTREEAYQKLADAARNLPPVAITDKQEVWLIPAGELQLRVDLGKSIEAAYEMGRSSNIVQRWQERWNLRNQPVYLPVKVIFERNKLIDKLASLSAKLDRRPRSASLQIFDKSKEVALRPAVEGRRLNTEKTVNEALNAPQSQLAMVIELKFDIEKPQITDAQFDGINALLASYSTYFKPWDSDRNANLRLATKRIHGKKLKPGEVFSYNDIVGNRTQQQGFYMAPVILNGKLVPDWGGGVCQVSSTLYNAALLANLDIVERSNHGMAIGYVPLGFDATVVDGLLDLKFKNNLKNPILIYAAVTEDELVFYVLGDAKDMPPNIELDYIVHKVYEPVEIKQPDPMLEVGKEVVEESPQRGFRVSSYRIRQIDGKEERQLLATDDYEPVNRVIKVGSKPVDGQASASAAAGSPDKLSGGASTGALSQPQPASVSSPAIQTVTQKPKKSIRQ